MWAGVWRSGNDSNFFTVDKDLKSFTDLANQRNKQGLMLVDIDTFTQH
jgi:hypothetical protein